MASQRQRLSLEQVLHKLFADSNSGSDQVDSDEDDFEELVNLNDPDFDPDGHLDDNDASLWSDEGRCFALYVLHEHIVIHVIDERVSCLFLSPFKVSVLDLIT